MRTSLIHFVVFVGAALAMGLAPQQAFAGLFAVIHSPSSQLGFEHKKDLRVTGAFNTDHARVILTHWEDIDNDGSLELVTDHTSEKIPGENDADGTMLDYQFELPEVDPGAHPYYVQIVGYSESGFPSRRPKKSKFISIIQIDCPA